MLFVNSGLQYWVRDLDFLWVCAKTIKSTGERTPEYIYIYIYIYLKEERKNLMNIKLTISQLMKVT
jgi:hypothetical protein